MEIIKALSLGNPNDGFKNYFMHGSCFDEFFDEFLVTEWIEWSDYNGTQFADRICVRCGHAIQKQETSGLSSDT